MAVIQVHMHTQTHTYVADTKIISDSLQRYIDSMQSESMWQTQYSIRQSNYGNRRLRDNFSIGYKSISENWLESLSRMLS